MSKSLQFQLKQHIRCAAKFDTVLKQGKRLSNDAFVFCYVEAEVDYPRLGMIVAKRHCRLAVSRNRIKRKIREHFRLNQHALRAVDLVVLLRSSTEKIPDREQDQWLEKLFSHLVLPQNGLSSH